MVKWKSAEQRTQRLQSSLQLFWHRISVSSKNVPNISDVSILFQILRDLGANVRYLAKNTVEIDTRNIREPVVPYESARHLRASYYFLGAFLGRFGEAHVSPPGGCNFGVRPIDQHIKGFEALGCNRYHRLWLYQRTERRNVRRTHLSGCCVGWCYR